MKLIMGNMKEERKLTTEVSIVQNEERLIKKILNLKNNIMDMKMWLSIIKPSNFRYKHTKIMMELILQHYHYNGYCYEQIKGLGYDFYYYKAMDVMYQVTTMEEEIEEFKIVASTTMEDSELDLITKAIEKRDEMFKK